MSNPYVGEIRMFGGSFNPNGWAFCDGSLLPISENDTLFNLIGTTYGGDGQSTFGLPNLNGRVPIHQGTLGGITYTIGESAGTESVTLTTNQIPNHTHAWFASGNAVGLQTSPQDNVVAQSTQATVYIQDVPNANMAATIQPIGGNQPHDNMQPYLCITYIISLFGIYPSQT